MSGAKAGWEQEEGRGSRAMASLGHLCWTTCFCAGVL